MRLVLHLMKKDLHRLRWDIALYALLVLSSAVILAFRFRPPQDAWGAGALHSLAANWIRPSVLFATWSGSLEASRDLVQWIGFPIGGAIVLATQALTLKTRRAVAVGIIAQMLFIFSSAAWTWDFVSRREPAVDPAVLDPGVVKVQFEPPLLRADCVLSTCRPPHAHERGESVRQCRSGLDRAGRTGSAGTSSTREVHDDPANR